MAGEKIEAGQIGGWTPELGSRFSELLSGFGTLKAAAAHVGKKPEQLAKWRDGAARIPLDAAASLCAAQGRSIDWLVFGRTAPVDPPSAPSYPLEMHPKATGVIGGGKPVPRSKRIDWIRQTARALGIDEIVGGYVKMRFGVTELPLLDTPQLMELQHYIRTWVELENEHTGGNVDC